MNPTGNQKTIPFIIAAFVLGVLGTVLAMTALRENSRVETPAVAQTEEAEPDEKEHTEKEHHDEAGVVHLSPEGVRTLGIRTEPVAYRTIQENLTVPATVEAGADRIAKITPPVVGKVVLLYVKPGDTVTVGQPLAVLDSFEIAQAHAAEHQAEASIKQAQAAVLTARAEVAQARTRQKSAEKALATQRDLARAGVFSQAPLQAAQTELAEAQSELLTAQTELQSHSSLLQRAERLFNEGIISRTELEQAQLERREDEARVEKAKIRLEAIKQTLAREQRVAEAGLLNRQAVQTAEAEVRAAEAGVVRAVREEQAALTRLAGVREGLEAVKANLDALEGSGHIEGESSKVTVYAPISGIIASQTATLGETVERSSTLLQIENLGAVLVQANIPEKDIRRVRVGLRVTVRVTAFPGETYSGVVQSLASRVDEKTRTLPVRCLVSNPSRHLRPEMFATVTLPVGASRRTLVVPEAAIVTERDESETSVAFVAGEEAGEFEKRVVRTGESSGPLVEVREGLKEGDPVVIAGAYALLSEAKKGELSEAGHSH